MRILLLPLLLSTLLGARPPRGMDLKKMPNLQEGPVAARLYNLRMCRIQKTLGLPEEQAKAITERWKRYDAEFMNSAKRLDPLRQKSNEILRGPAGEDEKNLQLKPLLDQFIAERAQQERARHRFEEDMRANLSPAQQVRLILLMEELHQELMEIVRQTMREHRRGQEN